MTEGIIMGICFLPIIAFIYFPLANEAKFKKNIVVGVTFPYSVREDPDIRLTLLSFKKELRIVCLVLAVAFIPLIFYSKLWPDMSFGIFLSLCLIWVDLLISAPLVPYIRCNAALKRIKAEKGWRKEPEKEGVITVDTQAIDMPGRVSPVFFIIAALLNLLPTVWERTLAPLCIADAAAGIFLCFFYRYCYRDRSEAVDDDITLTKALTRVRRYNWAKMYVIAAFSLPVISFSALFMKYHPAAGSVLVVAVSVFIAFMAMRIEFGVRHIQEKLTEGSGRKGYIDTDDYWLGGIVYCNPYDSKTIVNARVGLNTTVNIARTKGKIICGLLVVLLMALPLTGVWVDSLVSAPIEASYSDSGITWSYRTADYAVRYDEINSAELLSELPDGLYRTWGTGTETLLEGRFSAAGVEAAVLACVDPTVKPFIFITTADGRNYLLGTRDPLLTESVYKEISGRLN